MKRFLLTVITTLSINVLLSQNFNSDKLNFVDFKTNSVSLDIDNFTYKGNFNSFYSKKDKTNYFIYSYFSRTVVFSVENYQENLKTLNAIEINNITVIHSTDLSQIKKAVQKKGATGLNNFIIVYSTDMENKTLQKSNKNFI